MSRPELTSWADALRNRYLAGEASLFLLHGNVRDLHPWTDDSGRTHWLDLRTYLERFLERTRDVVAYYNVSQGLRFTQPSQERLFRSIVDARRLTRGESALAELPPTAAEVIPVIEDVVSDPAHSSAVVIDFFEMVAPNADPAFMVHEDKANLVSLMRWSTDPSFLATDNLVILVTEHLSDVSRRLTASPQLATIHLSFPDEETRLGFLQASDTNDVELAMEIPVLAKVTAGLSLLQIRAVLRAAALTGQRVDFELVSSKKKKIIEQECHGLVEFVSPKHDFRHVGGMLRIKTELERVAEAVRKGRASRVPMGMIFVGPMGTGKTFLAEAFAAESGLTCLKLKNFRDKWVGSTEANLEKVLELVEALGYVLLILDEADRGLSSGSGSDGGVNSRVIARLKEFMSDTSHRGRVVILMMTNRPDKLDVDLKRPGRFDMKIPFFFPEAAEERRLIFEALCRKNKLQLVEGISFTNAVESTDGYSGAEIEAVLLAANSLAGEEDQDNIDQKHLDQAVADLIPSRDTRMLEYMELLAVFESSSRKMLPERFRDLDTSDVQERLDRLRTMLGARAR
ncbi:MAG: transitional endoplasmic reticulum ATPase [Myxococcota bacterium]|jgi:transitional endoplasmic reticulum ATPase